VRPREARGKERPFSFSRNAAEEKSLFAEPYAATLRPNGGIPTFVPDDGVALTDFVVIATWLAEA
jgi:glutathione S-transferase